MWAGLASGITTTSRLDKPLVSLVPAAQIVWRRQPSFSSFWGGGGRKVPKKKEEEKLVWRRQTTAQKAVEMLS